MKSLLASLAVVALAVTLAACGRESGAEGMASLPKSTAVTVTVAPVTVRAVERTVSIVGTLEANEQAQLASESQGQVTAIEADLGDRVEPGQVLARVRTDVLEARLREAEASLAAAVADEGRSQPLRSQGIIAPQEYEKIRTALEVARARRDLLRIELEQATIRSPFAGSVSERLVNLGDYVQPGTAMFRLVQDDPLKFRGELPERDVPALLIGQDVRISVDAYPDETFTGRVSRVGAASDPTARALAFEVLVPNADHRIRPGFFGRGDLVLRRDAHAVAVPRSAVTSFAGVTKLFVVEDGVAHERPIVLGADLGDGWVEVTDGVTQGMQVATSGLSKLTEGAQVTVRETAEPDA
jgi:membrane fusion protein (multidrug efflux system)